MTPRTVEFSREELLRRREEVLREANLTREELKQLEERGWLRGDQWRYAELIEEIEFLLGDDAA